MLHEIELRTAKTASKTSGATEAPPLDAAEAGRDVRTLSAGDFLFQEGDPRTHAFRIESGGICVYKTLPDGGRDVLEFAFSGDLVGLGYHGNHVATAQATTQTSVSCLPSTAQEPVTKKSRPAKAGVSTALEREAALIHGPSASQAIARSSMASSSTMGLLSSAESQSAPAWTRSVHSRERARTKGKRKRAIPHLMAKVSAVSAAGFTVTAVRSP